MHSVTTKTNTGNLVQYYTIIPKTKALRFILNRVDDETGVSGTGHIADGVQFENMKCSLCWRVEYSSIAVYDNIEILMKIHGHNGKTVLEWIDNA